MSDRVGSELSHYGIEVEQFSRLEGRTLLQTVDALWHKERSVELFEDFSHLKTAAELLDKAALASHTDFRTWVRKVTAAGYPISGDTQSVPEDAAKIEYARLRKLDTEVRNHPGFPVNAAELSTADASQSSLGKLISGLNDNDGALKGARVDTGRKSTCYSYGPILDVALVKDEFLECAADASDLFQTEVEDTNGLLEKDPFDLKRTRPIPAEPSRCILLLGTDRDPDGDMFSNSIALNRLAFYGNHELVAEAAAQKLRLIRPGECAGRSFDKRCSYGQSSS